MRRLEYAREQVCLCGMSTEPITHALVSSIESNGGKSRKISPVGANLAENR